MNNVYIKTLTLLSVIILTSCQMNKQVVTDTVRVEFIGENLPTVSTRETDNILVLYFANNSADELLMNEFIKMDITKKATIKLLKRHSIQFQSVKVGPNTVFEKEFSVRTKPKTVFIKLSKENEQGKWRYKTIDGRRYKTTLQINGNYVAATQTPF